MATTKEQFDWLLQMGMPAAVVDKMRAAAAAGSAVSNVAAPLATSAASESVMASAVATAKAPAAPAKPQHKLSDHEQLQEVIKTQVINNASLALMQTYTALVTEVQNWSAKKIADIGSLQPHQTPKQGGLAITIAGTLNKVAQLAFPELMVIEVVGTALDMTEKVRTIASEKDGESGDDDNTKEVNAAKAAAQKELADLVTKVQTAQQNASSALEDKVEKAMANIGHEVLEELSHLGGGESQYSKIRELLKSKFGITRGTDADPGVFKKLVAEMNKQFKDWLKSDYQNRHLPKLLTDAAGQDSQIRQTLTRLYLITTSEDPDKEAKLKKGIADAEAWYAKAYGMGAPWGFEKVLKKMVEKEDEAYEDVYKGSDLHS